jgi:putative flavoprotein involved in K+ transport
MSRCLSDRSIEHVVLERQRVAERWHSERWDSLRLLTPNRMSRLPGYQYEGPEPDSYMTMPEVIDYLERYARLSRVPLETGTNVSRLEGLPAGFRVETNRGTWAARNVVIATGYCDQPLIPGMAGDLREAILQLNPSRYRKPEQLPEGGVLVVGAAASGIQLADEIRASGRPVTLAVGSHNRMLRQYRGKDILWWLDGMGILDETADQVFDLEISRGQPAFQLVGRPDRSSIDLGQLADKGVRIAGRAIGVEGGRMFFDNDLIASVSSADFKLAGLLARIDQFIVDSGLERETDDTEPFVPTWRRFFSSPSPGHCDLRAEGIRTVIWATGFGRRYPWLHLPVLDKAGEILHRRGVTPEPGLYVLGLQFQCRRKSAFIDGVGLDADELAEHLSSREAGPGRRIRRRNVLCGEFTLRSCYDAVIIGARCAGAATAMLLARQGLKVLAVDRSRHGSDTLSTHALMRGAVIQLHRWGLLDKVRATGTPPVSTTTFHYREKCVAVAIKPREGVDALYAPRRTVLDPILADAAVEAGAEILRGPRIVDLIHTAGEQVRGVVIEDKPGHFRQIHANIVIGADGISSTVARLVHARPYLEAGQATGIVYGYWEGLELSGYNWYFRPGVTAGAIATNGGSCVFAGIPQNRFRNEIRFGLDDGYFRVLREAAPDLAASLAACRQTGAFRGYAGHPGFLRQSWGPGWALVGDAAYFKDPITAHGITDALRDAELLARAVAVGTTKALADYQRIRDGLSLELFRITNAVASLDWELEDLEQLHKDMSDEMKREASFVSNFKREDSSGIETYSESVPAQATGPGLFKRLQRNCVDSSNHTCSQG